MESNSELTPQEKKVLENLASAWNEFLKLEIVHLDDQSDFRHAIHSAQNIILARLAFRHKAAMQVENVN